MADFPYDTNSVVWVIAYAEYSTTDPEHCGWSGNEEPLRRGDHVEVAKAWHNTVEGTRGVVVDHDGDPDTSSRWAVVEFSDGVWRQFRSRSLRKVPTPTPSFVDELLKVLT